MEEVTAKASKLHLTTIGVSAALRLFQHDPDDPKTGIDMQRVDAFMDDARAAIIGLFELTEAQQRILDKTSDIQLYASLAPLLQLLRRNALLEVVAVNRTASSLVAPHEDSTVAGDTGPILVFGDGRLTIRLRIHSLPDSAA